MNLLVEVREAFRQALSPLVNEPSKVETYLEMIRPAQNPQHGDYQANFAMALAKSLGKSPKDLAHDIVSQLKGELPFDPPTVAGPGFINIRLKDDWLAQRLTDLVNDPRLGVPVSNRIRTYVIDYSGPNVAKPLHVGHLRSTIIGESLCRILRFLGHRVIGDNHLGDWGTQFGMLLYGYKNLLNKKNYEENKVKELARLYIQVRKLAELVGNLQTVYAKFIDLEKFQKEPIEELTRGYIKFVGKSTASTSEDEDATPATNPIASAYREETAKLHRGDPENLRLWNEFMPACMEEVESIYRRLGVQFTHQYGESHYNHMLPHVVEDLLEKKIATHSQGAVIVEDGKNVALIRKGDGAYTYMTTDLATIQFRAETFKPDAILYVVDFRQADHFKSLFAIAKKWGYDTIELEHLSFGSVLGQDGKPYKTREGNAVDLHTLLDQAIELGEEKYDLSLQIRDLKKQEIPKLSAEEKRHIATVVGIGAVKYADLSQNRTSDYRFSFEKMLATEGNTATYMQYAYARTRSILRKSGEDIETLRKSGAAILISEKEERAVIFQLLKYTETLEATAKEYMPHYITSYLWDLCKAVSTFYSAENCHVLEAKTPELRLSRLLLVDLVGRTIQHALNLLGIETVESM